MNVGPVPRRPATDCPSGVRQDATLPPLIDGDASDAEPLSDLGQAHGLAVVHEKDCIESLDGRLARTDNPYMTGADTDPRCDYCERRFIRIVRGVAVCEKHLRNAPITASARATAYCCRERPEGGLDGPCTWPETDCYQ